MCQEAGEAFHYQILQPARTLHQEEDGTGEGRGVNLEILLY